MKWIRYAVVLALFAGLGTVPAAGENVSPWDLWRQGYTSFEKGESARDSGDHVKALEHFREAAKNYRAVQKARPSWNQNVINSRILLCEQEIADAKRLLNMPGKSETSGQSIRDRFADTAAEESSATVNRQDHNALASELVKMQAEIAQYKKKLFATLVEVEDLRRQAIRGKSASAEMENMLRERRIAEEKYRLLEARCKELETKAARPSEELAEANRKLVEMRINLETSEQKLTLSRNREQAQIRENADLTQEHNDLKNTLELTKRRLDAANQDAEALRTIRQQAAQEKNTALLKIAELEKQIALANDRLKGRETELATLDRRLQDALKSRGASAALSAEISSENEKLRKQANEYLKNTEKAAAENRDLQNRLRETRMVQEDLRNALRKSDERNARNMQEMKVMRQEVEKVTAERKLAEAENLNLNNRTRKLEQDIRQLSEQETRLRKRLDVRHTADRAAVDALAVEKTRLSDQISAQKLKLAEAQVNYESLRKRLEVVSQAAAELRAEYLKTKAQLLSAEQEIKRTGAISAERDKLKKDLADLQRNFAALQIEKRELARYKDATSSQQPELERLRKVAARVSDIERQNQTLSDRNAQLLRQTGSAVAAATQLRRQRDEALAGTAKVQQERDAAESAVVVLKRRESENAALLADARKQRDESEKNLASARNRTRELELKVTSLDSRNQDQLKKIAEFQKKSEDLTLQLADFRKTSAETELKLAALQKKLIDTEKKLAAAQTATAMPSKPAMPDKADPAGKASLKQAELAQLVRQRQQAEQAIAQEKARLAALQKKADVEAEKNRIAGQQAKNEAEKIRIAHQQAANEAAKARLKHKESEAAAEKVRLARLQAETEAEKVRLARLQAETEAEKIRLKRQKEAIAAANLELRKQMDAAVAAAQSAGRNAAAVSPSGIAAGKVQTAVPGAEKLTQKQIAAMLRTAADALKKDSPRVAQWNYRKILESEPGNFTANFGMGKLEMAQEEFAKAAVYLQQAHIAQENRADVRLAYAQALLGQKKYGNALAILDGCPATFRKTFDCTFARGLALAGAGQHKAARQTLLAAHKLRPKHGRTLLALAQLPPVNRSKEARMQSAKWYENAKKLGVTPDPVLEKEYAKLLNERTELVDFMSGAALEAEKHRDWNSAIWYYSQLRDLDPESGFHAERAARYCFLQKQYAKALQMLANRPETPRGAWLKAASLLGSGKVAEAEKFAETARKRQAPAPDADLQKILQSMDKKLQNTRAMALLSGKTAAK